jgi:hypothetical protein
MRFDEAVKEKYPHPGLPETTNTNKKIKTVAVSYTGIHPRKRTKKKKKLFRHIMSVRSVHEREEIERERAKAKRERAEEKAREKFHEKKKPIKPHKHVKKHVQKHAKKKKR